MKITLYWSSFSNRIFYVKGRKLYLLDGHDTGHLIENVSHYEWFYKIGEI